VDASQPVPGAFLSYTHFDDEHDNRYLTDLCRSLSGEVRMHTGVEFEIFQDRTDIKWGQNWRRRLESSLDAATFLIPIITPSYFRSKACCEELAVFVAREKQLGHDDLILPVYYVETPLLENEAQRAANPLAEAVAAHQYADWRDLRFEPLTSQEARERLADLAKQVRDALERTSGPALATAAVLPSPKGLSWEQRIETAMYLRQPLRDALIATQGGPFHKEAKGVIYGRDGTRHTFDPADVDALLASGFLGRTNEGSAVWAHWS
jgi:hypothetical protein